METSSSRLQVAIAILTMSLLGAAGYAGAQAFPTKPVRVINPAAPGGNSDVFFRLLQPKMSEALGQQVVMDYRPGAGGTIGGDAIVRSAPDGYTTGLVAASFVINPSTFKNIPYDTRKDFTALGIIVDVPSGLVVHPSLPVKHVKDLIAQTGETRSVSAKDVPTMVESGLPGFVVRSLFGFVGPARIPRPVAEKLNGALVAAIRDPKNNKMLIERGADPVGSTLDEHAASVQSEIERWRKVAKAAGIEPQ